MQKGLGMGQCDSSRISTEAARLLVTCGCRRVRRLTIDSESAAVHKSLVGTKQMN
jgi:hypothetical protein